MIYEGGSRTQAAELGGVTLQVVRDWVLRFNADGPAGLIDRKAPGQPSRLKDQHRAALAAMVENGPIPAVHGVVRWRIIDLCGGSGMSSRSSFRRAGAITPRRQEPSRGLKKMASDSWALRSARQSVKPPSTVTSHQAVA